MLLVNSKRFPMTSLQLPVLHSLRQFLKRQPRIVWLVRAARAIWWLGPWRNFFIRYHQRQNRNPLLVRNSQSLLTKLDTEQILTGLRQEGFAPGIQLPKAAVSRIVAFCGQQDSKANPHLDCPTIHDIAHDPKLLEVVKAHFGAEPVLFSSSLYWTWPPESEEKRQQALALKSKFHYDVGDFKTLIVFIYLTDVDEDSGPHVVIQGSQGAKPLRRLLSRFLPDQDAYAEFGDRIHVITGKRGTGFFEDLTCYHKHSVGTKARLMLTLCYLLQRKPL